MLDYTQNPIVAVLYKEHSHILTIKYRPNKGEVIPIDEFLMKEALLGFGEKAQITEKIEFNMGHPMLLSENEPPYYGVIAFIKSPYTIMSDECVEEALKRQGADSNPKFSRNWAATGMEYQFVSSQHKSWLSLSIAQALEIRTLTWWRNHLTSAMKIISDITTEKS